MTTINRRRFLAISASAACLAGPAQASTLRQWSGTGLGARMTITLDHPQGESIARKAFVEVDRLENIFSLYRPHSALARLNADGLLKDPPFELLECLSLCAAAFRATGGFFDPTVQPLWKLYAQTWSQNRKPEEGEIASALEKVGWDKVDVSATAVRLAPGSSLTLNGIAQGYVADRIAALLKRNGLTDILIDTGEHAAIGGNWPVMIDAGRMVGPIDLRDQALASSAPLGTVFDAQGQVGHILDPRTGLPAAAAWRVVSVTSSSAAIADAWSTAAALMNETEMLALFAQHEAKLVLAEPL